MKWHERLRDERKRRHLSQQELADTLNVARANLSRWELGKQLPTPRYRRAIAEWIGEDVATLFKEET